MNPYKRIVFVSMITLAWLCCFDTSTPADGQVVAQSWVQLTPAGGPPPVKFFGASVVYVDQCRLGADPRKRHGFNAGVDELDHTIALGVPNARMIGGGNLIYTAWVSAAGTITVQACNANANSPQKSAGTGSIRVDLWKH